MPIYVEWWDHSVLKSLFKIKNSLVSEYLAELLPLNFERSTITFETTKTWLPPNPRHETLKKSSFLHYFVELN